MFWKKSKSESPKAYETRVKNHPLYIALENRLLRAEKSLDRETMACREEIHLCAIRTTEVQKLNEALRLRNKTIKRLRLKYNDHAIRRMTQTPFCVGCGEAKSPLHFLPGKDLYICKECTYIISRTFEIEDVRKKLEAQNAK